MYSWLHLKKKKNLCVNTTKKQQYLTGWDENMCDIVKRKSDGARKHKDIRQVVNMLYQYFSQNVWSTFFGGKTENDCRQIVGDDLLFHRKTVHANCSKYMLPKVNVTGGSWHIVCDKNGIVCLLEKVRLTWWCPCFLPCSSDAATMALWSHIATLICYLTNML